MIARIVAGRCHQRGARRAGGIENVSPGVSAGALVRVATLMLRSARFHGENDIVGAQSIEKWKSFDDSLQTRNDAKQRFGREIGN